MNKLDVSLSDALGFVCTALAIIFAVLLGVGLNNGNNGLTEFAVFALAALAGVVTLVGIFLAAFRES